MFFFAFQIQSEDSSSIKSCCDFCNKSFYNKQSRNRHVKNVHLQIKSWQCEFCKAKFNEGGTLKHHVLAKHKKIKPWNCKLCEMTFTQKSNLTTHVRNVHENPSYTPKKHMEKCQTHAKCQICNEILEDISKLSAHMSKEHSKKVGEIVNDDFDEDDNYLLDNEEIQNALKPIVIMKVQEDM